MTLKEKREIFESLIELAMYEYRFLVFIKSKDFYIDTKLISLDNVLDMIELLSELYQSFLEI